MLEETAIVVKIEQGVVWVASSGNSACSGCAQKAGCATSAMATVLKKKPIPVTCDIALKIGDSVLVAIEESALLQAAFSLYGLPLIALFIGAGLADWLLRDLPYAELWIAASAVASLGFALLLLHKIHGSFSLNYYARPIVVKKC